MATVLDGEMATEALSKCPTGIKGLDEIMEGGLPLGRSTLVSGNAGCGKTVFAMEFLFRGAAEYDEPGVFMAFEEKELDLVQNFASMGMHLNNLMEQEKLRIDFVRIDRNDIEETGEYTLDGLFIRLNHAIDSIGAKRVVLDTLDVVFSELENSSIIRSELKRLLDWLKSKNVTAVVTGERGTGDTLTRYGMEEYVADCVVDLEHKVLGQIATRRMRIIKYRGSAHGTNEYPFLIDEKGINVMPITSIGLDHSASTERFSTGISQLDAMMGDQGVYRGSSILVSGMAGTGKTSLAASFVDAGCRRGETCLWFAFEESPQQIQRNMNSVGIDLKPWADEGLLKFHASRPTFAGLEMHLVNMIRLINELEPSIVVLDPISNLTITGTEIAARGMLIRLIDYMKSKQVTSLFTNLIRGGKDIEQGEGVSSLMDTWFLLRELESNGERTRGIYVLKSRGMEHSNQIREFQFTREGIKLVDVYIGPNGVLTGSARSSQEARDNVDSLVMKQKLERLRSDLERKKRKMERQIEDLRAELEGEEKELAMVIEQGSLQAQMLEEDHNQMISLRQSD